jgi:hypothetical protein
LKSSCGAVTTGKTRGKKCGGIVNANELRELLGLDVLLLPCKSGTKKPVGKWKELTAAAMADPAYMARLDNGNIGVALGQRSGGLCSLDIDSDDEFSAFAETNKVISQTLCSRGARGGNLWWRLRGAYPRLTPLKKAGAAWGEWRSDGAQTIIWGRHPNGGHYRFLRRLQPLTIDFSQIKWPANMTPALSIEPTQSDTESTQPTEFPKSPKSTERTETTDANTGGVVGAVVLSSVQSFEEALSAARTSAPGHNHERLFTLARGAKAVELAMKRPLTETELRNLFNRWFAAAKPHLKKELSVDDYWFEFLEGYENVKHPLGTGFIEAAWNKASTTAPPAEANQFQDLSLRRVVTFCRELWLSRDRKPFFLSCRTLQGLLEHPDHVRAARWLRGLCRAKILAVVEAGGAKSRRASRYQYLPSTN